MEMFDNQILVFRVSTLLFIIAVFAVFLVSLRKKRLNMLRRVFGSVMLTAFAFLIMELSWEIASGLRWSVITPLPHWTALQGQPVMFLSYLVFVLLIAPFVVISVRNGDIAGKEVWIPLTAVFCYYIVANMVSPSIYFNDYGYAIRYSGETSTDAQKLLFLIPEYFLPRIGFIVALLVTHARVKMCYANIPENR